jgi:MraZ protein
MSDLLGEFEVRLDSKGRFKLPSGLKRQLPPSVRQFVITRGFEECLMLYPWDEWEKINARLKKLNEFKKDNRDFLRYFKRGANYMELDGTDRLLIPKQLKEHASIEQDIVLASQNQMIEIWDRHKYYEYTEEADPDQFAELAEKVMGQENMFDDEDEQG